MSKRKNGKNTIHSRRNILKKMGKTSTFIVPTILTFKLSELKAHASSIPEEPSHPK